MAALLTPGFLTLLAAQAGVGYALASFFLLPRFLAAELGAGPAEIGRVVAAERLAACLLMPLMGVLVDRFGRRDFLTAGALLMAAAALGFTAVHGVGPYLYALRLVQGLGFAMAFAAGAALAVDESPPERLGQAIGLFGLTMLSMNALAPALLELIAVHASWSWGFATAAFGGVLGAGLSRRLGRGGASPEPGRAAPGLWQVARRPRQLRINAVVALVGTGFSAMFVFHQTFADELGIERVGSFFVAYTVGAVGVRLGLGSLVDRADRRRVTLVSLLLYTCAVIAMRELATLGLALLGTGLGVAHGLWYPALNAIAVESVRENERGKVMALFQSAFNVGWSLGPLALGAVAEARGHPTVFLVAGACTSAALALFAASPEGREASRRRPD